MFIVSLIDHYSILSLSPIDHCKENSCKPTKQCVSKLDGSFECVCRACAKTSYEPVCASNGKSYASYCYMIQDACRKEAPLQLVQKGICGKYFSLFYTCFDLITSQSLLFIT